MNSWVTILTFTYPHEAYFAKGKLESEDISVLIKDELVAQVNNFYSNAIGGVKLQVQEKDLDRAYKILVETGYIKEQVPSQNRILVQFDKFTLKIPLFGRLILEMRLIISIVLALAIIIIPLVFITLPSKLERLMENTWCIEKIYYQGHELTPYSHGVRLESPYDNCSETMNFSKNGDVVFPGINSYSETAHWEYRNDRLIITKLPDVQNFAISENLEVSKIKANIDKSIYSGIYKFEIKNDIITLKSDSVMIIGKIYRFNYRF